MKAFLHAWKGYEDIAWGADEVNPIKRRAKYWVPGGIGMTIIDSLDTILLMNLKGPYEKAREWVKTSLNFDKDASISMFETTIRILGGLLSAYDLSHEKIFLEKAIDIGNRLLWAFNTSSGIPFAQINLRT